MFRRTPLLIFTFFGSQTYIFGSKSAPFSKIKLRMKNTCAENSLLKWAHTNEQGILVSPQDDRNYRIFKLQNGIKALAVQDAKSQKAAASMAVGVGASSDPATLSGLAHFCEHMLFLGTEKYPVENTYKAFLNSNGGQSNAATSMEYTCYKFDVSAEHLREALDIFAHFFVDPLFTESGTEREMNAVDSEDAMNRTSDDRRFLQVMKAVGDPSHPYTKFSTGNKGTLICEGLSTREELLKLHKTHYYAENMSLVVIGKESTEELEAWATECFSGVSSRGNPEDSSEEWRTKCSGSFNFQSPFPKESLPKLVQLPPLRDTRQLQLQWPMPSLLPYYRASPASLFSHLIGHEGKGSLFAALQDEGWALSLSAGTRIEQPDFSVFQVKIQLTEEGEEKWKEVVGLVNAYLLLLQNISASECSEIWSEIQTISASRFRFLQETSAYSYAEALAHRVSTYPREHILAAGHLKDKLDFAAVGLFLPYLTSENMNVFHVSKRFEGNTDLVEKWYGVPYKVTSITMDDFNDWHARIQNIALKLHFPSPNPYIPDDFNLLCGPREKDVLPPNPPTPPVLLPTETSPLASHLWHKVDSVFRQPRAVIMLLLATPVTKLEPAGVAVLTRAFTDSMAQEFYPAEVSGLSWSFTAGEYGLEISISGFSQHASRFLANIIEALVNWIPDSRFFLTAQEAIIKNYKNWRMNRPDTHCSYFQKLLLQEGKQSVQAKLQYVESMKLEDLFDLKQRVLSKLFLQALVHGNIDSETAKACMSSLATTLASAGAQTLPETEFPQSRVAELGERPFLITSRVPNEEENNSALLSYFQFGPASLKDHMRLSLLAQVLKEPISTQLRTKEQIGYVVFSGIQTWGTGKMGSADYFDGFYIKILSKNRSPSEISERIQAFIESYSEVLENMSQETFQSHIQSKIMKLREPPKKLAAESALHWREIFENTYFWDRFEQGARVLESGEIDQHSVCALYQQLCKNSVTSKRLEVMLAGNKHTNSLPSFREGWECFPVELIPSKKRCLSVQPAGLPPAPRL